MKQVWIVGHQRPGDLLKDSHWWGIDIQGHHNWRGDCGGFVVELTTSVLCSARKSSRNLLAVMRQSKKKKK